MSIKVYNTLTGEKELLEPQVDRQFTMYTCGPTVYDSTHAGHLIPPVIGDVIKRYLEAKGYRVIWAHNFTDIEDKIIERARREGVEPSEVAERYMAEYLEVLEGLGIDTVDVFPKVSDHLDDIIEMIEGLVEKGYAYEVDGDVYFSVTRFEGYGKLSRRTLEELQAGARIEVDERKQHPADFALWKAAKEGEPGWDSPWGKGRPGWHIECSVMSAKHLGYPVDIHGGGIDLKFPHHENEIAQSEAYMGSEPFVRYWLHNGLLKMEDEKMSKSLGNFVSARDLLRLYGREVLRFYILSHHYRRPREFSEERLDEARRAWGRWDKAVSDLRRALQQATAQTGRPVDESPAAGGEREKAELLLRAAEDAGRRFDEAMSDDFNTAEAIGVLFDLVREVNAFLHHPNGVAGAHARQALGRALDVMERAGGVLGILRETAPETGGDEPGLVDALVRLLLEVREEARRERDWVRADTIRDRLAALGIIVEDSPAGPRWRRES